MREITHSQPHWLSINMQVNHKSARTFCHLWYHWAQHLFRTHSSPSEMADILQTIFWKTILEENIRVLYLIWLNFILDSLGYNKSTLVQILACRWQNLNQLPDASTKNQLVNRITSWIASHITMSLTAVFPYPDVSFEYISHQRQLDFLVGK